MYVWLSMCAAEKDVSGGWLPAPYLVVGHDFRGLFQGHAVDKNDNQCLGRSESLLEAPYIPF